MQVLLFCIINGELRVQGDPQTKKANFREAVHGRDVQFVGNTSQNAHFATKGVLVQNSTSGQKVLHDDEDGYKRAA